ncbi:MAG: hypothetical protein ACJ8EL_06165 [Rhizomicrobium sp.]
MTQTDIVDPRRQRPITIRWDGLTGTLFIDGESWGAVEWSDKRQAYCIEDAEGRCLSHHSHIHGKNKDKDGAVALAEAMIRDGRMPTPEEARKARRERLKRDRERRAKQPSEIKRQEARAERDRLWDASYEADRKEWAAEDHDPLHEVLADALNFADPELWKSNSFARLRDRLIIHLRAEIAKLEAGRYYGDNRDRRLNRAREILELLLRLNESATLLTTFF